MRTIINTTTVYTPAELQLEHPNGFASAVERYTDFLRESGIMDEDLTGFVLPNVLRNEGCPSLEDAPLRYSFGFSQGDGVSFDNFDLTYNNIKELGVTLPEGVPSDYFLVRRDTGYIGNHYTHENTFDVHFDPDYYEDISDELRELGNTAAEELTEALRDLCSKMYRAGEGYVLDDEAFAERFLNDDNDSVYDEYGYCAGHITETEEENE